MINNISPDDQAHKYHSKNENKGSKIYESD